VHITPRACGWVGRQVVDAIGDCRPQAADTGLWCGLRANLGTCATQPLVASGRRRTYDDMVDGIGAEAEACMQRSQKAVRAGMMSSTKAHGCSEHQNTCLGSPCASTSMQACRVGSWMNAVTSSRGGARKVIGSNLCLAHLSRCRGHCRGCCCHPADPARPSSTLCAPEWRSQTSQHDGLFSRAETCTPTTIP